MLISSSNLCLSSVISFLHCISHASVYLEPRGSVRDEISSWWYVGVVVEISCHSWHVPGVFRIVFVVEIFKYLDPFILK
jgi:hypothetical protein